MSSPSAESLELPVFDGSEPLLYAREIANFASQNPQTKVIRYCRARLFDTDNTITVDEAVAIAERELSYVQESLGICVIKHGFGLYPLEAAIEHNPGFKTLTIPLPEGWETKGKKNIAFPEGFILGAEVSVIDRIKSGRTMPQAVADTYEWFAISVALESYKEEARGIYLGDLNATQCILGLERAESPPAANRAADWIMADIEPLLKQK